MLAATLLIGLGAARPALAQNLADSVVSATPVSESDKQQIGAFVKEHAGKLKSQDAGEITRARRAFTGPLVNPAASASFRQEYSRQLLAELSTLVGDAREEVAANAVRLCGMLGTRDGLDQVLKGMEDKRASVRVLAAMSAGFWFESARMEGRTPLTARNVNDALDELATRMTKEQDPRVLDAMVLALDDAMHSRAPLLEGVRPKATMVLIQQTSRLAQANPGAGMDLAFGHAVKALIDALIEEKPEDQLKPNVVSAAACVAGDVVAQVQRRVEGGGLTETERAQLAITAAQAERIVQRAAQLLGSAATKYELEASVSKGDDARFKADAQRMFKDLAGSPFDCKPAGRYPKGS